MVMAAGMAASARCVLHIHSIFFFSGASRLFYARLRKPRANIGSILSKLVVNLRSDGKIAGGHKKTLPEGRKKIAARHIITLPSGT